MSGQIVGKGKVYATMARRPIRIKVVPLELLVQPKALICASISGGANEQRSK